MLDIRIVRDNVDRVKVAIQTKGFDPALIDELLQVDDRRRVLQSKADDLRSKRKTLTQADIDQARVLKQELEVIEKDLSGAEAKLAALLYKIPNLPSSDTPIGRDDTENVVLRTVGQPRTFDFTPKNHYELGRDLGIIDSEKAGEVSGTRFTYTKGRLVLLELALVQYAMSVLTDCKMLQAIAVEARLDVSAKPFLPVLPPVLIKSEVMEKMARLEPKEERYHLPTDDLYLIGSAEHTLGPIHMGEMRQESELPLRYVGFSTAFRREAGSYGKDTRGIFRLHQFNKTEMESFTLPEHGQAEQDFFVAIQEYLNRSLNLPYEVLICCTGDQGDPDARHLDINTWMPSENKYRETHSADYMTDYQARRLITRVKRADGETVYVHMNDATVFAGRTLIAIMENYQQADGSLTIPEVLVPFCGFSEIGARAQKEE